MGRRVLSTLGGACLAVALALSAGTQARADSSPVPDPASAPTSTTGFFAAPTADSNAQTPPPNPANDLNPPSSNGNGPVMHNPTAYLIFWLPALQHFEPAATSDSDTAYENLMIRFFQDVGATNFYNIVTQYPDGGGAPLNAATFGGSTVDTTAYPKAGTNADPLQDSDIRNEVHNVAASQHWTEDIDHEFFVYTGNNVRECFGSDCNFSPSFSFCAYHFNFTDGGHDAIYAYMGDQVEGTSGVHCGPQPGGVNNRTPNNDITADAQVSVTSHEFIESVTDPKPNTGWSGGGGGAEIGDKCNATPGPQNADGGDVFLHGNEYLVQMEWSNAVHGCAMDLCGSSVCPPPVSLDKSAPATVTTGDDYTVTLAMNNPSDTDAATKLVLTDTLPAGSTYRNGSANPAPSSVVGPLITWNFASLAVHDSLTVTFTATAGQALQNGTNLQNCSSLSFGDSLDITTQTVNDCATTTAVNVPPTLVLPGDQSGDFDDTLNFTISATDPEASDTLTFTQSGLPAGLTFTDNGNRTATISGTIMVAAGTYPVTFSVNDAHNPDVTGTLNIIVTLEETTLTYTGPTVIANGQPVTLSAVLKEDGITPIGGRTIVFTLGTGSSQQTCSGVTNLTTGIATCTISVVNQPVGNVPISAVFAGDAFYEPASASATALLFSFLSAGAFVIGDGNAAVGTAVTFWGAQWSSLNTLSGGPAPSSFKGFASNTSQPPANGTSWTCRTGNSPPPPNGPLPAYMGVVVTDSVTQSGSTINGDSVHIVVVRVDPGYASDPGHPGTGTVVAVYS